MQICIGMMVGLGHQRGIDIGIELNDPVRGRLGGMCATTLTESAGVQNLHAPQFQQDRVRWSRRWEPIQSLKVDLHC